MCDGGERVGRRRRGRSARAEARGGGGLGGLIRSQKNQNPVPVRAGRKPRPLRKACWIYIYYYRGLGDFVGFAILHAGG